MNWTLLLNSLLVSALTTLLSVVFGFMAALWLAGLTAEWRRRCMMLAIVALSLPPFLVTNCWLHYFGLAGVWHHWLPVNLYSLGGTVWILALLNWPITLLATLGAWRRLEPSQLESDMAVTGGALVRGLLLPLARGALLQAAVLTFVIALNNFAVPAILQVKVFPAEVWVSFNTTFDSLAALKISWPMVVVPLLLLFFFRHTEVAWPRVEGSVTAKLFRQQLGAGWSRICGCSTIFISLLAVGLPLLQLASTRRTWLELPGAIEAGQMAIWNSFYLAVIVATLCLAIGLMTWRWPVGVVLWLPFFIPGVLMGIGLIAVFNRPIFAAFYQHAGIVILALGIRYLAFGWNGASRALRSVDRDLTDAARLDGASRWQLLRHVHWPQISPQLAVAWYIIFLLCLWDVESMVLIVPPGGETLALRVFNLLHYGHNAQVNSLCLTLLILAIAPLVVYSVATWKRSAMALAMVGALAFLPGCSVDNSREKSLDSKIFSKVEIIGTRGVGVGEFNKPRSVALDHDDNLFVVDMTGRVQKFSPDGKYLLQWQMPQTDLGKPKGMGCDKNGNIIVIEPHYQRINIFSPAGKLVDQWGQHGTNAGQLIMPRAVAINSHGNFLIPEYTVVDRVQEFTPGGKKLINLIGHPGIENGEFNRPEGIAVDKTDRIYVADSCNHRIQIFSPEGKWLRSYGKAGRGVGEMSYPYDVRVDEAGRQYVCEFENSRIQIFDTNGQSLEIIGRPGAAPGEFSNPYGIALDSHGNLYVADSQNHRVQKIPAAEGSGGSMNFQFTHPYYLLLLPVALGWVIWLSWKSDVQISRWRRWTAFSLRAVIVSAVVMALAGLQWMRPLEGMNVFFLLDRSDSIPSAQQDLARDYVNKSTAQKKKMDKGGVIVFGSEANIETGANAAVDVEKIQAVVGTERTDIAGAIRLGTAAFPETGQKRLVLMSDGNENTGDAMTAVLAARQLGVSVDVVPMGVSRGNDVAMQKLSVPPKLKKGQVFEVKIFLQSDEATPATVRLYRDDQYLGEQKVELSKGKNLFTFPQTLAEPGFYTYDARVEAPGDTVPQNNRASAFTSVQGEPQILLVSSDLEGDKPLVEAMRSARLQVKAVPVNGFPGTLAEMQSYDAIFLCNVAAGDLGKDLQTLLESAVRDFGVGLVCVGGDQTYAAGGYRGTPLENTLPVNMELDSKKVLPSGAVALVMHGMEFMNGNQVARDCALGVLQALGPMDEMGVVLWDGNEHWLFPMTKVGNKKELGRTIAGMNQGDLPGFEGVMGLAHEGLKKSTANLKHIIVFSDGDPAQPSAGLMQSIVGDRITVSTVLIAGHAGPDTMIWMADHGKGRFYNVTSPNDLPQIFIKEAAVILKSAIYEDPFKPVFQASSELVRGIGSAEYPTLLGYVATTPKPRAEIPLVTDKGDPLLAHWQYGLGRAVAFTSDAKAKWGKNWLGWGKYQQFWSQIAQWSLRRLENSDFNTDVSLDQGVGQISTDALDEQGNYRNFLDLEGIVVSPKGQSMKVQLQQTGPGHYEAKFPTKEVGTYTLNLLDKKDGKVRGHQVVGASINYSPEFSTSEPNMNLLRRLAESGGGRVLKPEDPADNTFLHDRQKTYQPRDLWEWLLKFCVLLFPLDVAVRRIQLDQDEIHRAWRKLRSWIFFWQGVPREPEAEESLAALLSRREQVRSTQTAPAQPKAQEDLFRPQKPVILPTEDAPLGVGPTSGPSPTKPPVVEESEAKPPAATTTSRLLDAKRRAQRRKD